ncbi:MAG: hypothetical protein ABIQ39_00095 [Ilumatobacteraceae bacterium]
MSTVTVAPQEFKFVMFDAELTRRVAEDLVASFDIHRDIQITIDETTPLARISVQIGAGADDPIVVHADSGAFEDTRRPRHQSETATATALGRVLHRAGDRLHGGFGEAPPDDDLTLAQMAAWETYSVGRLERHGIAVHRPRWLYNFRNRHGFSDAGDVAFDALWSSDGLTWGELDSISASAIATSQVASPA